MIDLWDINTYGAEVRDHLERNKQIVTRYFNKEIELDKIVPPEDPGERILFKIPPNPHYEEFRAAVDNLGSILGTKTFRAFHYTRMTNDEVKAMLADGIVTTSVDFLRTRVDRHVAAGRMTADQAGQIVAYSPLPTLAYGNRKGFWTSATPIHPNDDAVSSLVGHWGGESAYWCFLGGEGDLEILELLKRTGHGRIIEVAVPLSAVSHGNVGAGTASNAFDEYGKNLGYERYPRGLDSNIEQLLPSRSILKVHTEGDDEYGNMGAGYPSTFVPRYEG